MMWQPADTAPMHETVLVAWPLRKLDVNDMPTGDVVRVAVCLGIRGSASGWDDLGAFEGTGQYFDDDHEPVESPSHWMPLPSPPTDQPQS